MLNRTVSGKIDRANLAHFRFLGLRKGECDATAIRSAARTMSGLLAQGDGSIGLEGEIRRRSEIALATYRLLDPRRRKSFYERVQLCYPIDRDDHSPAEPAMVKWIAAHPPAQPLVPAASRVEKPAAPSSLMALPVIEQAIREELAETACTQCVSDTSSWLEERRDVVRSLRNSELSEERNTSTIAWIRTVLGW